MEQMFSKKEVIEMMDNLLRMPDHLIDAVQNEHTEWDAKKLVDLAESCAFGKKERSLVYDKLKYAFQKLQELYIQECQSNPNHVLNKHSFIDDWNKLAGLK